MQVVDRRAGGAFVHSPAVKRLALAAVLLGNLVTAIGIAAVGVAAAVFGKADDAPGLVLLGILPVSACALGGRVGIAHWSIAVDAALARGQMTRDPPRSPFAQLVEASADDTRCGADHSLAPRDDRRAPLVE
jgi:hypothetical protein